jgi:hypothetical protein
MDGRAYAFASQAQRISATLDSRLWIEVVQVYVESLKEIWWFGLGISVLALLLVFVQKELPLSKELQTEYGLEESGKGAPAKEKVAAPV